jgi:hypothetical protein
MSRIFEKREEKKEMKKKKISSVPANGERTCDEVTTGGWRGGKVRKMQRLDLTKAGLDISPTLFFFWFNHQIWSM